MPITPIKVLKDEQLESSIRFDVNNLLVEFNELIAAFNNLPLGDISSIEDFNLLYSDLQQLLIDKIPDGMIIGGVTLQPVDILRLLNLDITPIQNKLSKLKQMARGNKSFSILKQVGKIVDGSLVVDSSLLDNYLDERIYTHLTTQNEIDLYEDYEEIVTQIEAFATKYGIDDRTLKNFPVYKWFTTFELPTSPFGISKRRFLELKGKL